MGGRASSGGGLKGKAAPQANFAPLWQACADGCTALRAAEEFVQSHWDNPPRQLAWLGENQFKLQDGVRTYRVVYRERTADRPALWQTGVVAD